MSKNKVETIETLVFIFLCVLFSFAMVLVFSCKSKKQTEKLYISDGGSWAMLADTTAVCSMIFQVDSLKQTIRYNGNLYRLDTLKK